MLQGAGHGRAEPSRRRRVGQNDFPPRWKSSRTAKAQRHWKRRWVMLGYYLPLAWPFCLCSFMTVRAATSLARPP
jgi:hypothetical protein